MTAMNVKSSKRSITHAKNPGKALISSLFQRLISKSLDASLDAFNNDLETPVERPN